MSRHLAYGSAVRLRTRPMSRAGSSFACMAFVALLGVAFWAGAVFIGQTLLRVVGLGF